MPMHCNLGDLINVTGAATSWSKESKELTIDMKIIKLTIFNSEVDPLLT